ncbi:Cathepsin B-like cysteine-like protein [Schistosoma japonicum]|nr:Cathepsin B-like cysteine-like protein [Schistosoma japonicum]
MPRRLRSPGLLKQDRKLLKSLKAYQMGHIQRIVSVTRSASCAPDRSLTSIPPPPIARTECRGGDQILGLLCRLPDLLHVKNDKCSHLDVIWSELPLVCLRYSCVAAEPVQEDTLSDLRNVSDQLLDITPYGSYAIRLISRMLILHQSGKIFQEDWCITPLPSSYVEECSLIITEAVSNFMTLKTFAPVSTFEAGIQDEAACSKLVEELSSATGMNKSYSLQCLTECQFNLDSALYSFQKVQEAGLLPAEAFAPN